MADGVALFRHGGQVIPVVDYPAPHPHTSCPVIVFREGATRVGIAAVEIGDAIEGDFALEFFGRGPSVLAVANIGGSPVEIVDPFHLIDRGPKGSLALPAFASRPSVLLIEPAALARELVARVLRSWGCRVSAFKDHVELALALPSVAGFAASFIPASGDAAQNMLIQLQRGSPAKNRSAVYGLISDVGKAPRGQAPRSGLDAWVDRFDRGAIHAAVAAALATSISGAVAA